MNALSEHLEAIVYRDGKVYKQEYSRGKALNPVEEIGVTEERGTQVTFKPDHQIFDLREYSYETLANRMRELSYLNKGIKITMTDKRIKDEETGEFKTELFHSEIGLAEFVRYIDETRESLISDVISMEGEKNGIPVEVAMIYNTSYAENIHAYVK